MQTRKERQKTKDYCIENLIRIEWKEKTGMRGEVVQYKKKNFLRPLIRRDEESDEFPRVCVIAAFFFLTLTPSQEKQRERASSNLCSPDVSSEEITSKWKLEGTFRRLLHGKTHEGIYFSFFIAFIYISHHWNQGSIDAGRRE